jgi:hypothetical protein
MITIYVFFEIKKTKATLNNFDRNGNDVVFEMAFCPDLIFHNISLESMGRLEQKSSKKI